MSLTISLAIAVDGTLDEVMKIVAEWLPEDMIPAHISEAFFTCTVFSIAQGMGAESCFHTLL